MFKKFFFGIAFIAIVAIATIYMGISSKNKNSLVNLKNDNIEALASSESDLGPFRICEDSQRYGHFMTHVMAVLKFLKY